MSKSFERTDDVESTEDLICTICWDDDEDIEGALAPGVYRTCAGEWRKEEGETWRFWRDPTFVIPGENKR